MKLAYCKTCTPPVPMAIGKGFAKLPTHEMVDGNVHTATVVDIDKAEKMTAAEVKKPQLYLERMMGKYVTK